jgi:hypothetical protein
MDNSLLHEYDVTLFFRRAFKELLAQKDWNAPDIVLAQIELTIP